MQRQIPPLAQKMLDTLETFIKLDTPFRIEERRGRVDLVRSSLSKPKVTASEQVRQVLKLTILKQNTEERLTPTKIS